MEQEPVVKIEFEDSLDFSSDADKFQYLNRLLSCYKGLEHKLLSAKKIDHDINITTADGRILYIGGAHGAPGHSYGSREIIPFSGFVKDLVWIRVVLGVSESEMLEAEGFNERLLDYAIHLYGKRLLPEPQICVQEPSPEKIEEAAEEIKFAQAAQPANFIAELEQGCRELWLPKIRKNTGDYDPNHIREKLSIAIYSS